MESQDSATLYLFKIWPAIEANKNRIIAGSGVIVLLVLLALFSSWHKNQKEIEAGQAFSQMLVSLQPNSNPAQLAESYLKIANDYAGTSAAQRAQLQGAADLFAGGNYADAQTQFQKFADANPGSSLTGIATLGIAASLDAQGKTDAAVDSYKKVIDDYGDIPAQVAAKFALAAIYEHQGKPMDAIKYYEDVARTVGSSTLGQQASLKSVELKLALPPPAKPTVSPVAPATSAPALPPSK